MPVCCCSLLIARLLRLVQGPGSSPIVPRWCSASCSLTGPGAELGQLQPPSPEPHVSADLTDSSAAPGLPPCCCCSGVAAAGAAPLGGWRGNTELLSHAATPGQPSSVPSQTSSVGISAIRGGSCHQSLTCFMFPAGPSWPLFPRVCSSQTLCSLRALQCALLTSPWHHLPGSVLAAQPWSVPAPLPDCWGGSSKGPWGTG